MLNEDGKNVISDSMKEKIDKHNVHTFYSLAKLYKLASTSETSLAYIERCFPIVVEEPNFLHLDIDTVVRILDSSELNIHSEVEVFNAAINWLEHDIEERSKYAKQLLLKVRLALLSEHAFEHISDCKSLVCKNIELCKTLKEVLLNQKTLFLASTDKYITSRYCSQNKFNVLICGGRNEQSLVVRNVHQVDGSTLNYVNDISEMKIERINFEAVSLKGEVYVFGGYKNRNGNVIQSVEKYSLLTNTWNKVAHMFDKLEGFCACAFMDKIFILGAFYEKGDKVTSSCFYFDIRQNCFIKVSKMIHARMSAACVVFQGNIVVSGGMNYYNDLNSVESYDVFANKWSLMPSTINSHRCHSLVVVKDKLFVIGDERNRFEVFDNVCKKFVSLKHPFIDYSKSVAIGNRIIVFKYVISTLLCYDVDKDEWSEESFELTEDLDGFSCAKLPLY